MALNWLQWWSDNMVHSLLSVMNHWITEFYTIHLLSSCVLWPNAVKHFNLPKDKWIINVKTSHRSHCLQTCWGGRGITPSFKTRIGFLTDTVFDKELVSFCTANEKLFLSQVVGNGQLQKPIFKGYFFIPKDFLASWVLNLSAIDSDMLWCMWVHWQGVRKKLFFSYQ